MVDVEDMYCGGCQSSEEGQEEKDEEAEDGRKEREDELVSPVASLVLLLGLFEWETYSETCLKLLSTRG